MANDRIDSIFYEIEDLIEPLPNGSCILWRSTILTSYFIKGEIENLAGQRVFYSIVGPSTIE